MILILELKNIIHTYLINKSRFLVDWYNEFENDAKKIISGLFTKRMIHKVRTKIIFLCTAMNVEQSPVGFWIRAKSNTVILYLRKTKRDQIWN